MSFFFCAQKSIALFLAVLLLAPAAEAARVPQQPDASSPQQGTQATEGQQENSATPDAPSPQVAQSNSEQSSSDPQDSGTSTPVGTAAAPSEKPVGVTGARPAGAVIAPAKQRRVRTILISIGVVIGAGVAIGTVAALSHSSPSQPH
jgi:cytoskeletal protein RodZ